MRSLRADADGVFRNVISEAEYYVDLNGGDLIEVLVPFTIFFPIR